MTIMAAFCLGAPVAAMAQPLQAFTSDTRGIAFSHPAGWEVIPTDRRPTRYLENFAVQPRGQQFSGYPGQVAIRVFDPMFVVEEARVRLPASASLLFQRFVRSLPGGQHATFGTRSFGGVTYLFASEVSDGFQTDYAAIAYPSGMLNVAGMASNPREAVRRQPLLFQITRSMSAPWPDRTLDAPAAAVRNWYRVLRTGQTGALLPLACSQAMGPMLLLSFASPGAMSRMTQVAIGYDFSGLRFQTVASGSRGAVVRVAGNLVAPNGTVTPVYQNAGLLGGSNSFAVRPEAGGWKVCGPVRGGNR